MPIKKSTGSASSGGGLNFHSKNTPCGTPCGTLAGALAGLAGTLFATDWCFKPFHRHPKHTIRTLSHHIRTMPPTRETEENHRLFFSVSLLSHHIRAMPPINEREENHLLFIVFLCNDKRMTIIYWILV